MIGEKVASVVCCLILAVSSINGQSLSKQICITVDDLPTATKDSTIERWQYITTSVLNALRQHEVPAVGFVNEEKLFVNGKLSAARSNLLTKWFGGGIELGNHTWSHIDYNTHTTDEVETDLVRGEHFLNSLYSKTPDRIRYFRHPYLHRGDTREKINALMRVLQKHHYVEAPVTIDNSDWIFARAYDLALERKDTAMQKKLRGDYVPYMMSKVRYYESQALDLFGRTISQILLIHSNTINAACLETLLNALKKDSYKFISLSQALADPAYKTPDDFIGRAGISWIHRWAITRSKPRTFFGDEPLTPEYVQKYSGLTE
jgi:peptidoglycan/xylan/chitin deacetylase (PgdA/CDA1 family)